MADVARCVAVACLVLALGACGDAGVRSGDAAPAMAPATQPPPTPQPEIARRAVSRSQHAGRRHLEMEVSGASLGDVLTLQVAFVNRHQEAFALVGELGGEDFLLVEADGSLASPRTFDAGLQRLSADGSMAPGAIRRGAVVFAPPQGSSFELCFADFTPLPLVLDRPSSASAKATSATSAEAPSAKPSSPRTTAKASPQATDEGAERRRTGELRALLQRGLDRQAQALEGYDLEAYLQTFAPSLRARERQFFANIRSLPLLGVGLRLGKLVSSGQDAASQEGTVELRYGLDGQPTDNPFVHSLRVTWRRQGGAWQIVGMEDAEERPVPWRVEALTVHRSHHFLIATGGRSGEPLVDLAADAEAAYADLYRRGLPLATGYFVQWVNDRQLFARLSGRPSALGVALARQSVEGGRVVVDSRAFYVNGSVFGGRPGRDPRRPSGREDLRRTTVTHELVHLALSGHTRPYTPIWLKEGAAVYFSDDLTYDANRAFVQRGLEAMDLARLTTAPILGQHDLSGQRTADEYIYAGNLVSYLIDLRGEQAFLDFYASFAELPPHELASLALAEAGSSGSWDASPGALSGRLAASLGGRQLQRSYRFDVSRLEADLAVWLRLKYR